MVPRIPAISSGDWGVASFSQVSTTPTEIFIISIGLRTFQKAESALFDLALQAVNEGEISMGTDHDSGEISVAV